MRNLLISMLLLSACTAAPPSAGQPSGSQAAGMLAAAGAAVLYVEGESEWRIKLHHVDAKGTRTGVPVEVSAGQGTPPLVTLASNGTHYLACWELVGQISCAVPGEPPTLLATGSSPALAYNAPTWAVAYGTSAGLVVQALGADGRALGAPTQMFGSGLTGLLSAHGSGFVLAGGDPMRVQRLDSALKPAGAALDLGRSFWFRASVAATATTIVVSLGIPYAGEVYVTDGDRIVRTFEIGGGGKTGLDVALTSDGTSIAGAWFDGVAQWSPDMSIAVPPQQHDARGGAVALTRVEGNWVVATVDVKQLVITAVP